MALDLKAKVSLDGSGWEAGIHRLEKTGKEAFGELKQFALAAFGVYGAQEMMRKSIENAKELVTAARRVGSESVEDFEVLREAAKNVNTDLNAVVSTLEKLRVNKTKALEGDAGKLQAFTSLGISPQQLRSMNAQQLFVGPLSNASRTLSREDSAAAFKEVLGKGFGEILPVLSQDLSELSARMHKLGTIIDTQTAKALVVMEEEISLLSQVILGRLSPAIIAFAEGLYKALGGLASTAAALGAGTANWKGKDFAKVLLSGPLTWGLNLIPGLKDKLPDWLKLPAFDSKAAKEGGLDVFSKWNDSLKELKKKIDELLKGGGVPIDIEVPEKPEHTHRIDSADSLVKVGNFLGDSQGSLVNIAQQQLVELRGIRSDLRTRSRNGYQINTNDDPAYVTT
jgi:hypothetical protein